MVSIEEFKEIHDMIPGEPEFELWFGEGEPTYMITKYAKFATFQRYMAEEPFDSLPNPGEIKYPDLDTLLSSDLIDGLNLRRDWGKIKDIVASGSWRLEYEDDIEDLKKHYRPE